MITERMTLLKNRYLLRIFFKIIIYHHLSLPTPSLDPQDSPHCSSPTGLVLDLNVHPPWQWIRILIWTLFSIFCTLVAHQGFLLGSWKSVHPKKKSPASMKGKIQGTPFFVKHAAIILFIMVKSFSHSILLTFTILVIRQPYRFQFWGFSRIF